MPVPHGGLCVMKYPAKQAQERFDTWERKAGRSSCHTDHMESRDKKKVRKFSWGGVLVR